MIVDTSAVVAIVLEEQGYELVLQKLLTARSRAIGTPTLLEACAAAEANLRFGKGRHPAALNFGDCMTYAVAKVANMPLLFIGGDFGQTDLTAA